MRVLFIADELFPGTSANSRILFRIIDQLLEYTDMRIDILGQARSESQDKNEYLGCKIIHTPYRRYTKYKELNKKLRRFKFLRFIIYPRTIVYRLIRAQGYDNPYIWEAEKWLKKNHRHYDAVVAMSMPYYNLEIAASVGDIIPVVFYPLEPIASFDTSADDFKERLDYEISLENRAAKIILTNLIHKDFLSERTRINDSKVIEAEFPCVFNRYPHCYSGYEKSNKRISLVYVGKFYAKYREPNYLCKLMDYLPDDEYELTIVGGGDYSRFDSELVTKYLSNKHPSIHCVGFVMPEIADDYLLDADILIHVGNSQPNIMPSKILDYISTGKPIVNICKTHNCPTLPIMEKYPLGLVVFEDEGLNEIVAGRINEFCKSVSGQKIPFITSTPRNTSGMYFIKQSRMQ